MPWDTLTSHQGGQPTLMPSESQFARAHLELARQVRSAELVGKWKIDRDG
jgi:hypothetical protein